jgi:hypothetical protein
MDSNTSFLLGRATGTLMQIRAYLIRKEDVEGLALIEDGYQAIVHGIEKTYYSHKREKSDDRTGKG